MNLNKKATVLMPVYNGEQYLKEAIFSVLTQSYSQFDLLIINDGSTDSSNYIIKQFKDERIKYIENSQNMGLISTLNRGLKLIKGDYILRMDQDDICSPRRFEKQILFMDNNRDVAVCGTGVEVFGDGVKKKIYRNKFSSDTIKTYLLFFCVVMHPTVILRNSLIKSGGFTYNETYNSVEDFGLWQLISFSGRICNIPEVLLKYRINITGITFNADKNVAMRDKQHGLVYRQGLLHLGITGNDDEILLLRKFIIGNLLVSEISTNFMFFLLDILNACNSNGYNRQLVSYFFSGMYCRSAINNRYSFKDFFKLYDSYCSFVFSLNYQHVIKFILFYMLRLFR